MITLKRNMDRRIVRGHLWVFSNEIADPPVSELEPGEIHELVDASGEPLGMVYANPSSLITARLLSRKKEKIDLSFLRRRLLSCLDLRKRLFPEGDMYRLVFGESDLLPGLVVDRYGSVLAVQSLTAGMDRLLPEVVEILVEIFSPEGICLRNDAPIRSLEGLSLEKRIAYGAVPDKITIDSGGLRFPVDVPNGQKTGFYLDQERNRILMKYFVRPGDSVLDLFSYSGGWGIHAAAAGASDVTAVDSSRGALSLAETAAQINRVADRLRTVKESVLDFLKKTHDRWDVVVLDPPAFIKSRSALAEGRKGYIDLNRRALTKLNAGGLLVTCSCSHHLPPADFEEILLTASRQSGKPLRMLDIRGQGPDHPVLLSMPETRYLKVVIAQALVH
jgi:23S rRNA (cytosine1962-C5)-methyltransferase